MYVVLVPFYSAILTVSSDCTNTIVECERNTCRYLGNLKKFDIRQGNVPQPTFPSNRLLNMTYVKRSSMHLTWLHSMSLM